MLELKVMPSSDELLFPRLRSWTLSKTLWILQSRSWWHELRVIPREQTPVDSHARCGGREVLFWGATAILPLPTLVPCNRAECRSEKRKRRNGDWSQLVEEIRVHRL